MGDEKTYQRMRAAASYPRPEDFATTDLNVEVSHFFEGQ